MSTTEKVPIPVLSEAGKRGAAKRWAGHEPKTVRLDTLPGPERRLILSLIAASKAEASAGQD